MTVALVTGATGFIGRHAVVQLEALGHEVHSSSGRALDLLEDNAPERLLATTKPELVLHLAWFTTNGKFRTSPANQTWLEASLRLAAAADQHGVRRMVVAGTCEEYDLALPGPSSVRATPTRPATEYGRAKDELRQALTASRLDLEIGWGRIFFLYGPNEHPDRLVASVARALVAGRPADVSHGQQVRDFLHVSDVARGLVHLLTHGAPMTANIGSGEPITVGDIATRLGALSGRPELVHLGARPAPPDEPTEIVADIAELRENGWAPTTSLDVGLAETLEWWAARAHG